MEHWYAPGDAVEVVRIYADGHAGPSINDHRVKRGSAKGIATLFKGERDRSDLALKGNGADIDSVFSPPVAEVECGFSDSGWSVQLADCCHLETGNG